MQCLAAMNCSRKRLYSNAVAPGPGHLGRKVVKKRSRWGHGKVRSVAPAVEARSEEHTSELQSLMRISYAVFCLKKKKNKEYNTKRNEIKKEIKYKKSNDK